MNADIAALTLKQIPYVTTALLRDFMLSRSLADIFEMEFDELVGLGFPMAVASSILDADTSFAEKELKQLNKIGGTIIPIDSALYPDSLKQVYDAPLALYVLGSAEALSGFGIAFVGSRKVSKFGAEVGHKLAKDIASCGLSVVSGLAYGVDIICHKAALEADGVTIAVLGSGLDDIYPQSHRKYVDEICKKGAVISEFSFGEPPNAYNFPKRNRIISGLCHGIVVVEASPRSGSLITSRLALEQGRDVFAVPTTPLIANNATNALIKNGAILVESYLNILAEYRDVLDIKEDADTENERQLEFEDPIAANIWAELSIMPLSIEEIILKASISYDDAVQQMLSMELDDLIRKGDDNKYYIAL